MSWPWPRHASQARPWPKPVLDALEGLAASLTAQGRPAEALPILQAEVEAGAKDLRLLFALAQAYRAVGRPEAAPRDL